MAFEKATIVIVHGSWHHPAHFQPLMKLLNDSGYPTVCPALPSTKTSPPFDAGMYDDAELVHSEVKSLVDSGKDVVVLCHSYGGMVGTQAITEELGKRQRLAKDETGGVVRIIYMCAFLLPVGLSMVSALGGKLPPFVPVEAQYDPITYAAYKHIPSTYLFCENDQALPYPAQQMMVEKADVEMVTETCDAGHSPFLSQPETVVDVVKRAAGGGSEKQ